MSRIAVSGKLCCVPGQGQNLELMTPGKYVPWVSRGRSRSTARNGLTSPRIGPWAYYDRVRQRKVVPETKPPSLGYVPRLAPCRCGILTRRQFLQLPYPHVNLQVTSKFRIQKTSSSDLYLQAILVSSARTSASTARILVDSWCEYLAFPCFCSSSSSSRRHARTQPTCS